MNWKTIFILPLIIGGCTNNTNVNRHVGNNKDTLEFTEDSLETPQYLPEEFFITDSIITSAGSMIYWQYNQDSSWLNYEEKDGKKTILNTMYGKMMNYTYLLGTQTFDSYPDYVVFVHEWISGCCTPPDIIFMDVEKPIEIMRIGSHELIRLDGEQNLCLYFTDSTLNYAQALDLNTNKSTLIKFPTDLFRTKLEPSRYIYPSEFFNDIERNQNELKIVYQYKNDYSQNIWTRDSLLLNLKN